MAQSLDGSKSSTSSEDELKPAWILSYKIKNTEDLEVHKSETDTGEDEDDEESYLNSLETEDISSALGPELLHQLRLRPKEGVFLVLQFCVSKK